MPGSQAGSPFTSCCCIWKLVVSPWRRADSWRQTWAGWTRAKVILVDGGRWHLGRTRKRQRGGACWTAASRPPRALRKPHLLQEACLLKNFPSSGPCSSFPRRKVILKEKWMVCPTRHRFVTISNMPLFLSKRAHGWTHSSPARNTLASPAGQDVAHDSILAKGGRA